jgi:hypothetical protein
LKGLELFGKVGDVLVSIAGIGDEVVYLLAIAGAEVRDYAVIYYATSWVEECREGGVEWRQVVGGEGRYG